MEGPRPQPGKWPGVANPTPPDQRDIYPGEGEDFLHNRKNEWEE